MKQIGRKAKGIYSLASTVTISNDFDPTLPNDHLYGFSLPISAAWFTSVIGAEYCHTYFWIIKDLAWMQGWINVSIVIGIMALLWSILIFRHSIRTLNWHEIWNFLALFLWLYANFWWMIGEAHDHKFPLDPPLSLEHTLTSARFLEIALCLLLFYYLVLIPLGVIPDDKLSMIEYDDGQLKSRIPCFNYFRQYENLHMLFWIAKDLAWNRNKLYLWILCLIPTFLIAIDLLYICASTEMNKDYIVDSIHYTVIIIWVTGNSVWAFGDFFIESYDVPQHLWDSSPDSLRTARWYSSWILCTSIIPILTMYIVWVYLTVTGKFKSKQSYLSRAVKLESSIDEDDDAEEGSALFQSNPNTNDNERKPSWTELMEGTDLSSSSSRSDSIQICCTICTQLSISNLNLTQPSHSTSNGSIRSKSSNNRLLSTKSTNEDNKPNPISFICICCQYLCQWSSQVISISYYPPNAFTRVPSYHMSCPTKYAVAYIIVTGLSVLYIINIDLV